MSAKLTLRGKAAVEDPRTVKSRWCDAEEDRLIELLEERPCLWDVFCKDYHVQQQEVMMSRKRQLQVLSSV